MSRVAILGAGPFGSAIAHRLAERHRIDEILLIDENAAVAAGKALDLRQAGPIGNSDARLSGSGDPLAATGADVIVLADDTASGAWEGERGLALINKLVRAGATGPIVIASPAHVALMETAVRELHVATDRLIGTAAAAMEPLVASLVNIELGRTGTEVGVTGRPPSFVVGWSAATIGGALLSDVVPPHRLLAISGSLSRLWPPGPQAIAAPTTLIVEALVSGSRKALSGVTILDGEFGARGRAALLPLEIERGRVVKRLTPSQSPQERTEMITGILR